MPFPRDVVLDWLERADHGALPALYRTLSIDPSSFRAHLRRRRFGFVDPAEARQPSRMELDATAQAWITRSARQGSAVAAVAGLAGLLSVPPEAAAQAAAVVRLAQRLAVIHGVEPGTSHGDLLVWRAIATALGVAFPEQGGGSARLSELPRALVGRDAFVPSVGVTARLAGSIARSSAIAVGARLTRWIPWVATAFSASDAQKRIVELGRRIHGYYGREVGSGDDPSYGPVEEADEVDAQPG